MATQGFGFMGFSAFYSSAKKTTPEQAADVFRFREQIINALNIALLT